MAAIVGLHHERLDGSGYHRGCRDADIDIGARVLAAADALQAMTVGTAGVRTNQAPARPSPLIPGRNTASRRGHRRVDGAVLRPVSVPILLRARFHAEEIGFGQAEWRRYGGVTQVVDRDRRRRIDFGCLFNCRPSRATWVKGGDGSNGRHRGATDNHHRERVADHHCASQRHYELLRGLTARVQRHGRAERLGTLATLDAAASALRDAVAVLLDPAVPDDQVRAWVFRRVEREALAAAAA